jgi:hypothetical protein
MRTDFFERLHLRYFIFLLSFLVLSCAEEDPDLVNPPLPSETVRIRFFNYAADKNDRKLSIDGTVFSPSTAWSALSPAITPPSADSVLLSVLLNNNYEYTDSTKLKLWRDTRYIVFALPKPYSDKSVDTLITSVTAFAPLRDTNHCYISLININNEPDAKYSVVVGCPNGPTAFPPIAYLGQSIEREVPSGNYPVSIIKIDKDNNRQSLGLFDLQLERRGDYTFVIMGDSPESIKLINRRDDGPGAMKPVNIISSTLAKIRTVNFSQSEISAEKVPDNMFLPSLASYSISGYEDVTACTSDYLDSIVVKSGGEYASSAQVGLVVNSRYSLLVFDSQSGNATKSMIVGNLDNLKYPENSAAVRVINMAEDFEAFSISLGARNNPNSEEGFIAGEQLTTALEYGKISDQTFVLAGRAPITVFSATSPQRLLHSFIGAFESGKSYLLIITSAGDEHINMSIFDESLVNAKIENLDEGVYAQFVHFVPEQDSIRMSIDNVIDNAKVYYSNSFATVLPIGRNTVRAKGVEKSFTTEDKYRDLLVVSGTDAEPEILHLHTKRMAYNNELFNRRVFNVAKDFPIMTVYDDDVRIDTNIRPIIVDLPYGEVSDPQSVYLERKFSYFFYDKPRGELLKQANDIAMSFGKNYTIVFGGNKKIISQDPLIYNYSILLIQEY